MQPVEEYASGRRRFIRILLVLVEFLMVDADANDVEHHVDFICGEYWVQHLLSHWELMKIIHEFDDCGLFRKPLRLRP